MNEEIGKLRIQRRMFIVVGVGDIALGIFIGLFFQSIPNIVIASISIILAGVSALSLSYLYINSKYKRLKSKL